MRKILLSLFLVALPTTAFGALLERDLYAVGDGLLTYDTETGLEWLDEAALPSLTWTELIEGVGGWKDLGFRIADTTETWQLLQNAGADHLVWAPSYAGGSNETTADAHALLSGFGVSSAFVTPEFTNQTQGTQNTSSTNAQIESFSNLFADYQAGDTITWDDSFFIRYYEPSPPGGSYIYAFDQGSTNSCNIIGANTPNGCPSFNTAIVRASPVPVPAAARLFVSGLLALGFQASKSKKYESENK